MNPFKNIGKWGDNSQQQQPQQHNYFSLYTSAKTTLKKTLLLESFDNKFSHQFQINMPYDSINRQIDLSYVLNQIFIQLLSTQYQYQVFYYSSETGYFHFGGFWPFQHRIMLGEEFISKQEIFVTFRKIDSVNEDAEPGIDQEQLVNHKNQGNSHLIQKQSKISGQKTYDCQGLIKKTPKPVSKQKTIQNTQIKKRRIHDRTIRQILEKVGEWRAICQKQKITLEQAAKRVSDIPKKTLDDYYSLIKNAECNGFGFQQNLQQKIGVLRKFVRQKQKEGKEREKSFRQAQRIPHNKKNIKQSNESHFGRKSSQTPTRKLSIIDRMILQSEEQERGHEIYLENDGMKEKTNLNYQEFSSKKQERNFEKGIKLKDFPFQLDIQDQLQGDIQQKNQMDELKDNNLEQIFQLKGQQQKKWKKQKRYWQFSDDEYQSQWDQ